MLSVPYEWLATGDETNFSIDAPKAERETDHWFHFPTGVYDALMAQAEETGKTFNEIVIQRLKLYQEMVERGIIHEDDDTPNKK